MNVGSRLLVSRPRLQGHVADQVRIGTSVDHVNKDVWHTIPVRTCGRPHQ
jgi:hypothetical protein